METCSQMLLSTKNIKNFIPFSSIVGNANILIMPGQHSAAISYKMMKSLGDTKVIGPLLIGWVNQLK